MEEAPREADLEDAEDVTPAPVPAPANALAKPVQNRSLVGSRKGWISKVRKANAAKWTPAMKKALAERSRRQQRIALKKCKCSRARKTNLMSRALWADGMKNAQSDSEDEGEDESYERFRSAPARMATKAAVQRRRCAQMESLQLARAMSDEEEGGWEAEESEELRLSSMLAYNAKANAALEQLECEVGAEGAEVNVEEDQMAALLEQLRHEPSTDAGREAKFALYEKFGETICQSRERLFKFWADCKHEFGDRSAAETKAAEGDEAEGEDVAEEGADADAPLAVAAARLTLGAAVTANDDNSNSTSTRAVRSIENELKRIDDPRHLGFAEYGRAWFVFHMAKKVAANNAMLDRVLADIERRLDMLSKQDECPICLEGLGDKPEVLGCCHKVCSECWQNWLEMQGSARAFCPLCRHNDFLGTVMTDE